MPNTVAYTGKHTDFNGWCVEIADAEGVQVFVAPAPPATCCEMCPPGTADEPLNQAADWVIQGEAALGDGAIDTFWCTNHLRDTIEVYGPDSGDVWSRPTALGGYMQVTPPPNQYGYTVQQFLDSQR